MALTAVEARLHEARCVLSALQDEAALTLADLYQAEQQVVAATGHACCRDQQELQYWMQCYTTYQSYLYHWRCHQMQIAQAALRQKKAWWRQLVIFWACLGSLGIFLVFEAREIQTLKRECAYPALGEDQWAWIRAFQNAQRKIEYLLNLQEPRQTPELREAQQALFSLRKKRDMLEYQILLQETRVEALRQQLNF